MSHTPYTTAARVSLDRANEILRGENVPWAIDRDTRAVLLILRDHIGKDNAIHRRQLAELLQLHDRTVREVISELRETFGLTIGSSSTQGSSGYFLIASEQELHDLDTMYLAYGRSIFRTLRVLRGRARAREIYGQLALEEGLYHDGGDVPAPPDRMIGERP